MMLVALTVFFFWLALFRHQGWAWIPAAILGFNLAGDVLGGSAFLPLVVIGAGVLLLSRGRMSNQATIGVLVLLVLVGIAARNAGVDQEPPAPPEPPSAAISEPTEPASERRRLPDLNGRQLVIAANSSDVVLTRASNRQLTADEDNSEFEISDSDGVLLLNLSDLGGTLDLEVPSEARVIVKTNSGGVDAEVAGFALEVETVSGDVDIELASNYPVEAETLSGEIEVDGLEDLDPARDKLRTTGSGRPVRIETVSGAIAVEKN